MKSTKVSATIVGLVVVLGAVWALLNAPMVVGWTVAGLGAAMVAMHWRAEIRHAEILRILAERQQVTQPGPGDWSPPRV